MLLGSGRVVSAFGCNAFGQCGWEALPSKGFDVSIASIGDQDQTPLLDVARPNNALSQSYPSSSSSHDRSASGARRPPAEVADRVSAAAAEGVGNPGIWAGTPVFQPVAVQWDEHLAEPASVAANATFSLVVTRSGQVWIPLVLANNDGTHGYHHAVEGHYLMGIRWWSLVRACCRGRTTRTRTAKSWRTGDGDRGRPRWRWGLRLR